MPHTLHPVTGHKYWVKQETPTWEEMSMGQWLKSMTRSVADRLIPDRDIKTNIIIKDTIVQLGCLANSARTFFMLVNTQLKATAKMILQNRLALDALLLKQGGAYTSMQQRTVVPHTLNLMPSRSR